jgi:serine/threonine protein kinase
MPFCVRLTNLLTEGAYGSVHPARLATTGEKVALKKISKRYTNSSSFKRETEALLRIYDCGGHPNISGLRDMYEDSTHFYLILDLISGGEMFDHLSNDGAYSEADAARLVFEIASALAFLHGVGVIHADLKPENLLLCSKNRRGGTIKIIDFGCSRLNSEMSPSKLEDVDREIGTTGYWPPERFQNKTNLTPAADMWALGIILYIMLTGIHPFDPNCDQTNQEIADAIKADPNPPLNNSYVGHLSQSVVDLMKKLMEPDPNRRITAYELLHHPWVRGETASKEKIEDSDKKLSQFQDLKHKLEASVFALLVNQGHQDMTMSEAKQRSSPDARQGGGVPIMKLVFDVLDEENKGYITSSDIGRLVTEHTGEVLNPKHTNELLMRSSNEEQSDSPSEVQVSLSDFSNLFSGLKVRHYPRGHYLFHAGDDGSTMYFLSSGKVEIQTRKGQLVALLRRGDFFGEGSLLQRDTKRFTSAKCATPVDVIEISREDFDRYTKTSAETRNDLRRKWRARSLLYAKNLLRLQRNVKMRTLKNGDVVYTEGDKGTSMFRVDDVDGGNVLYLKIEHPIATRTHKFCTFFFQESSRFFTEEPWSTSTAQETLLENHRCCSQSPGALQFAVSPTLAESTRCEGKTLWQLLILAKVHRLLCAICAENASSRRL